MGILKFKEILFLLQKWIQTDLLRYIFLMEKKKTQKTTVTSDLSHFP